MRKLLNTLYITKPDVYLATQGENIVVREQQKTLARYPLHNLQDIVLFTYLEMSPQLMERCMEYGHRHCLYVAAGTSYCSDSGKQ